MIDVVEPPPPPARLGRFEVVERLAVGGMAEVFLAKERGAAGLERLVVVEGSGGRLEAQVRY